MKLNASRLLVCTYKFPLLVPQHDSLNTGTEQNNTRHVCAKNVRERIAENIQSSRGIYSHSHTVA